MCFTNGGENVVYPGRDSFAQFEKIHFYASLPVRPEFEVTGCQKSGGMPVSNSKCCHNVSTVFASSEI